MTQLEEMSQLDTVVAVAEIVAEVAVAETVVVVVVVVEDFLESQKMRVFDNKLEIFQGPGSCMAQAVLFAFSWRVKRCGFLTTNLKYSKGLVHAWHKLSSLLFLPLSKIHPIFNHGPSLIAKHFTDTFETNRTFCRGKLVSRIWSIDVVAGDYIV